MIIRDKARDLANLIKLKDNFESTVVLIEGPRQVGKTTLVTQTLANLDSPALTFNLERDLRIKTAIDRCEDFADFGQWLRMEHGFVPDGSRILFIDEAQESAKLGKFVRFMKEDWKDTSVILTGSMMSRLFRDDTRYPVGRVKVLHVQGFSFEEFLVATGRDGWLDELGRAAGSPVSESAHSRFLGALDEYLHVGGLPATVLARESGEPLRRLHEETFEGYRRDFTRVFGEAEGPLFEKAIRAVADHAGSPSQLSHAVAPNEPGYKKLGEIFGRLESWRMVYLSPQRGPQPEGSVRFHPKRYLFDLGQLSFLRTLGVPSLSVLATRRPEHRAALGGILENFVAFYLEQWGTRPAGWKKSPSGAEIDFIARLDDRDLPVECKATLSIKENHLTGLKAYMRDYGAKVGAFVSCAPLETREYDFGRILCVPFYLLGSLPRLLPTA